MPSTLVKSKKQINRLQKRDERGRRCQRETVMQRRMQLANLVPKARLSSQNPLMVGRVKQRKSGHQKRPQRRTRKNVKSVRHLLLVMSLVLTVVVSRQCFRNQALEADRRKAGGYNLLCLSRERPCCQKLPKSYDRRWEREISRHLLQVCLGPSGFIFSPCSHPQVRCGSTRHTLSRCKKPADTENPMPFASCFVCSGKGHLASACPQNKAKGVYPNGGCCKICGDTSHLAKDCGLRRQGAQSVLIRP